jgi:hypothetical protein
LPVGPEQILHFAHDEVAARHQALVEVVEESLLNGALEVDNHVPADHEVLIMRQGIRHEVELLETHHPPDLGAHTITLEKRALIEL